MAVEVPLVGTSQVTLVDPDVAERVIAFQWRLFIPPNSHTGYVIRRGPYRNDSLLHRYLMAAPRGRFVDHINGDGLDNTSVNLRLCTPGQNTANRRKASNSRQPYKGVALKKDKPRTKPWVAHIGDESTFLGCFTTAEEAAIAYDRAAVRRFGVFACVNFPHHYPEIAARAA